MPRTTVAEVLACLEDEFAEFAAAFSRGEYSLWLGSGISRDVVPSVPTLLARMLEFLRANVVATDPDCRFRKALGEVFDVAGVPAATRAAIDLATPVDHWAERDDIVNRLVDKYSDVLDVHVRGEPQDFLVWTGLDVPTTYGSPALEPDVEHFCVSILMLEGIVKSAPTTNWDGLVEVAMKRLAGRAEQALNVVVTAADFRQPERQAELLKFHGCAVRAATNEAEYRSLLIARKSQISGWSARLQNEMMKNHLEHLFASRPALIVGLSAQDANIHTVLNEATRNLARRWPVSPAAVVFAEQRLHYHHKHVLQVTYGESYAPNAEAIGESALLGAYAKPALMALVLFTLTAKLCDLTRCALELAIPAGGSERVCADLRALRDAVGRIADMDPTAFIGKVISTISLVLLIFRSGRGPAAGTAPYQPISCAPIPGVLADPDFPGAALGRLAIMVSLLGRGAAQGLWTLRVGEPADLGGGVVRVETGRQASRLFFVRNSRAQSQLEVDGIVESWVEIIPCCHWIWARQGTGTQSPCSKRCW